VGQKPIFGALNKNNTRMAAVRAGLPVKIIKWYRTSGWYLCNSSAYCSLLDYT